MPDSKNTAAVLLLRGTACLGVTRHKSDGAVEHIPASFTPSNDGECIGVCEFDLEKNEPLGQISLFGDYQQAEILNTAIELLGPNIRPGNIPPLREMFRIAGQRGMECPLLNVCSKASCYNSGTACIFREWMDEDCSISN